MNALIAKEVRLLLPAYLGALALGVLPVWLVPHDGWASPEVTLYTFWLAVTPLALSSFGREFNLATFPLQLAQPLARPRIWWTKVSVLAVAIGTVLGAWRLSCALWSAAGAAPSGWPHLIHLGLPLALAVLAGGLWSTLLLRQVAGALWFTIFIPGGIAALIVALGGGDSWVSTALGVYAAGGFVLAWWLFNGAQEAMWTGGAVTLSGWRHAEAAAVGASRAHEPIRALFWKELQLHQVSLVGMGALLLLHLAVVVARKFAGNQHDEPARAILDFYPAIWGFVPVVIGSLSIAEERRLGTMQSQLVLPTPGRIQFCIKFFTVVVLGGLLAPLLVGMAELLAARLGAPAEIGIFNPNVLPAVVFGTLASLSVIAFYASSFTRNLLQAIAVSVALAAFAFVLIQTGPAIDRVIGFAAWRGWIFHLIAWPILAGMFCSMAYFNSRRLTCDAALWRGNLLALALALVAICVLATGIYHRGWELVLRLEPAHGPQQMSLQNGPILSGFRGESRAVPTVLADGRLRMDWIQSDTQHSLLNRAGIEAGWFWVRREQPFLPGSNWVDAVAAPGGIVAIRSDGTLWVSEKPQAWVESTREQAHVAQPSPALVRVGNETSWSEIVKSYGLWVYLLKRDGTLWRWGTNSYAASRRLGLRVFEPVRVGDDSNWARMKASDRMLYVWKKDGSVWVMLNQRRATHSGQLELAEELFLDRFRALDNAKWVGLVSSLVYEVGLREDGTLWTWRFLPDNAAEKALFSEPQQIGSGTNWAKIAATWETLAGIKQDGSLWAWTSGPHDTVERFQRAPRRLSRHHDWVAVGGMIEGIDAVAADGGLWHWHTDYGYPEPWLAPSRRPVEFENILAAGQ